VNLCLFRFDSLVEIFSGRVRSSPDRRFHSDHRRRLPSPLSQMDSEPTQSHYPSQGPAIAPEIISKSSPVPHTLTTTRSSRSISLAGWTVTSTKLPICSSTDCDELAGKLGIPVPEMTFGKNSVCIEGPNGWKCDFNTEKALDAVDKTGSQGIKVSYSEQWNRTRYSLHGAIYIRARDSDDIKGILKPYDWTYTTPYRGTLKSNVGHCWTILIASPFLQARKNSHWINCVVRIQFFSLMK
jgi:hypothetical protein